MSRFPEEMKVIPRAAWFVAAFMGLACLLWLSLFMLNSYNPWPIVFKVAFATFITLFMVSYVLLIGYVNGDARRRGMRHVMWTLLSIFIPNGVGIILYFILRDPLLKNCPQCRATVGSKATFCPVCGTALGKTCPACRHAVEPDWSHCASCGADLRSDSPSQV